MEFTLISSLSLSEQAEKVDFFFFSRVSFVISFLFWASQAWVD